MARGKPDYGIPAYAQAIEYTDFSLLSVVQNGFTFVDGRGRILWMDAFANGLNRWALASASPGVNPYLADLAGYNFGYHGVAVIDPVGSSGTSQMTAELIAPFTNRVGFEFYINLTNFHPRLDVFLYVNAADGTGKSISVRIEPSTDTVQILQGASYQTIYTPTNVVYFRNKWVNMKFVGDFSSGDYYRFVIGGEQIDVSGYSLGNGTTALKGHIMAQIKASALDGTNLDPVYLGGVNIVGDEP